MKKNIISKLIALALAGTMVLGLAACGNSAAPAQQPAAEETTAAAEETAEAVEEVAEAVEETAEETPAPEASGDVPVIKWLVVGSGMPNNYESWEAQLNAYIEPLIGAHAQVDVVPWGDWDSRRNVIINTGGSGYDIIFSPTNLVTETNANALMDITDLIKTEAPDLYAYIPADYWGPASINGKIYAIPTYKDSSASQYFIWDKDVLDDLGFDMSDVHSWTDPKLEECLYAIHEKTGKESFYCHKTSNCGNFQTLDSASTGLSIIGVRYNDESLTVINALEDEEYVNHFKMIHKWFEDGIINADAATVPEETGRYREFSIAQGWPAAADSTWGPNMGIENCVAYQWGPTIISNDSVRGSMNAISANAENPEKALQFLQLVNLDPYVRDLFYYGEEGVNWEYVDDAKSGVIKLNTDWSMAGYTQGTFFTITPLADAEVNQWDEVRELNENAEASVLLGFTMNTEPVYDQIANCQEIWNRWSSELNTGIADPDEAIPQIIDELNAAGFEDIKTELQNQINEWAGK